ncbi:MAG: hypothetical protein GTO14_14315 [Anaerolineales bacterium]|nr:hypothetical protein [Anaerolineales bacterium]
MRRRVKIDRLHLRIRGVPLHRVREALNGLGDQVLRQLADQESLRRTTGKQRIDTLQVNTIQVERAINAERLRTTVARALSDSLRSQVERGSPPEA